MFRPGTKRAGILAAHMAGVPRHEIAERVGCSGEAVRNTLAVARGLGADIPILKTTPRRPSLPACNLPVVKGAARDELRTLVLVLVEGGLSHRGAAREVGISLGLAQRLIHSRRLAS